MKLPMHGFGEKGSGGDDASLKSGLSGKTLTGERGGSLVKRLFRRKGSEEKGGE